LGERLRRGTALAHDPGAHSLTLPSASWTTGTQSDSTWRHTLALAGTALAARGSAPASSSTTVRRDGMPPK